MGGLLVRDLVMGTLVLGTDNKQVTAQGSGPDNISWNHCFCEALYRESYGADIRH
jgi:hypothetical protein